MIRHSIIKIWIFQSFPLIFIMFFQNYTNSPKRLIIPGYDELVGSSNANFQVDAESWEIVQKKLSRRPEGLEYLIFDKNYNLVLTNFTDFALQVNSENNHYSSEEIFNFIYASGKEYFYQVDSAHIDEEKSLVVITRLPRFSPRSPYRLRNPIFIIAIILVSLVIFCSIVIFGKAKVL